MLTRAYKNAEITNLLLSLTEFRKNLSDITENLISPRILMKNDVPKAVIMSYDSYVAMEEALESALDEKLAVMAEYRLATDSFVDSETFFKDAAKEKGLRSGEDQRLTTK